MKKNDRNSANKKKVFVRGYTQINLGDDLFFRILADRYPEIDFYINTKKEYNNIINRPNFHIIKYNIINRIINKISSYAIPYQMLLHKFDAIICIGGSIFMEIENTGTCGTIENNLKIKSRLKETPLYIVGCNYGPENTRRFREKAKTLFDAVDHVCFRDSYSYNLFKNNPKTALASDIVFLLPHKKRQKITYNRIGISLINIKIRKALENFDQTYTQYIQQIIADAIKNKKTVSLFSYCKAEGDLDECIKIKKLFDTNDQQFINIISYNGNIDEFLKIHNNIDLLYATRYHATILGLLHQIPTIPLIYSNKIADVLTDIGYKGPIVDIRIKNSFVLHKTSDIPILSEFEITRLIKSANNHFSQIDKVLNKNKA